MNTNAQGTNRNPLSQVSGIVGAIGGWALSQYTGFMICIPMLVAFTLFVVFMKARRPKYFPAAIAITAGHAGWLALGGLYAGTWSPVALDLIIMGAGILFLLMMPGLLAALFLGCFQLLALAVNVNALLHAQFGDLQHRALTAHIVFRLCSITALIMGYLALKRARTASISPPLPEIV